MLSAVGVIPARYGSSRLPGKPLADLQGKPLLYHVYQRAKKARTLERVLIATDDPRIMDAAKAFGAEAVMTRGDHRSGTDRIAEATENLDAAIVVNIQGDEPLLDFSSIDFAVELLKEDPDSKMSTLRSPIKDLHDFQDPNVVKVITDQDGYALYFSRSPIPYLRKTKEPMGNCFRHIGVYAYRRDFLMQFTKWVPSNLEILEDLEQLRALEHGVRMKVGTVSTVIIGIDTPEDLDRIRRMVGATPEILDA